MKPFWRKPAAEKTGAPDKTLIRRVEIVVDRQSTTTVVQRRKLDSAATQGKQFEESES